VSRSPIDILWNYLLGDSTDPVNQALKEPFANMLDEVEDLEKRSFSPLHRTIFGLEFVPLEYQLALSTADIDSRCSLGRTPLCWAALRKDPAPVRTLVEYGAAIHLADRRGQSPFHFAAETGAFESLKTLLHAAELGSHVTELTGKEDNEDEKENEATSCANNYTHVLSLIEAKDYKGRSPLHFASRTNQVAHASLLLRYGADIDSRDAGIERTPLLISIYWNHHDMIQLLLDKGASTDIADSNKSTLLHYAAKFGDEKTLRILTKARLQATSTESRDSDGRMPKDVFEDLRPSYLEEDLELFARSKSLFENLLQTVDSMGYQDLGSPTDLWFDAASSLEASPVLPADSVVGSGFGRFKY
jgi:ankyrin repeat protein